MSAISLCMGYCQVVCLTEHLWPRLGAWLSPLRVTINSHHAGPWNQGIIAHQTPHFRRPPKHVNNKGPSVFRHIFSKVFLIVRTMPRPTPMGIRHEVFALAREGIKQGAIAARVGLTRATVNRILKRHAATGSLVPGKSSGAPRKTTPR